MELVERQTRIYLNIQKVAKAKLMIIMLLNIIDGILTYISVSRGYGIEMNPITGAFIGNFTLMMILKVGLPTLLLIVACCFLDRFQISRPVFVKTFVNIGLAAYIVVSINHFYVLIQLISNINI